MFFILSKVLGFFTVPSNIVTALCAVGFLLLATQWRRAGSRILSCGIVLLLLIGYSPLANVLTLSLTERFPAWVSNGRTPDGIIVLGGAIDAEVSVARNSVQMGSTAERVMAMLTLARQYPSARIVYTGGSGNLVQDAKSEAPIAEKLLQSFGVARERILIEGDSRSTAENATLTRRMIQPKAGELWLLMTSAAHMPRSIGAFRKAGFNVEAYPVDWQTRGWVDAGIPFDRMGGGFSRADAALHEWIGLIAYWIAGRSSELFPGPHRMTL